jgi:hypothetical protein
LQLCNATRVAKFMKNRIKAIKLHIIDLKVMLAGAEGKEKKRINEEIHNAQFELKQLVDRIALLVIHCVICPRVQI